MIALETLFTELWRSHMATCPGLPDAATLHRVAPQDQAERAYPYLAFIPEVDTGKHPSTAKVIVRMQLAVQLTATESEAQGEAWVQAIRARIADREAFAAQVAALPEEQRQGWRILALAAPQDVRVNIRTDTPAKTWDIQVSHEVQTRA